MRGLSLTQPWASLVALGQKAIETRSWPTSYRGEILIHAAKGFPKDCQSLCWRDPFASALIAGGFDRAEQLPRGAVVAVARLVRIAPSESFDSPILLPFHMAERERAFGDFSAGRYGWVLQDVRPLKTAIPCKGALGLWTVPQVLLDLVGGQGVL